MSEYEQALVERLRKYAQTASYGADLRDAADIIERKYLRALDWKHQITEMRVELERLREALENEGAI